MVNRSSYGCNALKNSAVLTETPSAMRPAEATEGKHGSHEEGTCGGQSRDQASPRGLVAHSTLHFQPVGLCELWFHRASLMNEGDQWITRSAFSMVVLSSKRFWLGARQIHQSISPRPLPLMGALSRSSSARRRATPFSPMKTSNNVSAPRSPMAGPMSEKMRSSTINGS